MRPFNRVPDGESPLEVVAEIDPSLEYAGRSVRGSSRVSYLVKDKGESRLLKVCACPDRIHLGEIEGDVLGQLTKAGVQGVPKLYKQYNTGFRWTEGSNEKYDPERFSALLVEHIDGEDFHSKFRGPQAYAKLLKLIWNLHKYQVCLPRDFVGNVIVDRKGQPYLVDFEEVNYDYLGDYFKEIPEMIRINLASTFKRLKERIFKKTARESVN